MAVKIASPALAEHVAITYDVIHSNTLAVGTSAVPIAQTRRPCAEVVVQNDPNSADDLRIGNHARQDVVLQAGRSVTIPINDLSKVYVISVGTSTAHWLAVE